MAKRNALRKIPEYDPANNIGAVDRIRFAMINNRMDALSADEKEQFKRWQQIDDLIRTKRYLDESGEEMIIAGRRKVRNYVMVKYNITWDTAERDIQNAIKLFTPAEDDKEYYRSVYLDELEEAAAEAKAARKFKDYKGLMELIGEWRKFDQQPVEEQHDKFRAFQFIIEYNPEAIGLKTIENKEEVLKRWRKKKALTDKMADGAEDAEYVI